MNHSRNRRRLLLAAVSVPIGDRQFRLVGVASPLENRWETALNSSIPGDLRDTSTPNAMAISLHRLAFGDALEPRLSIDMSKK